MVFPFHELTRKIRHPCVKDTYKMLLEQRKFNQITQLRIPNSPPGSYLSLAQTFICSINFSDIKIKCNGTYVIGLLGELNEIKYIMSLAKITYSKHSLNANC